MGFSIYTYLLIFICSFGVAISVTFPIYFLMRISRKCKINNNYKFNYYNNKNEYSLWQYFVPFVMYICLMLWWWLGNTPFGKPNLCVPPS